MSEPRRNVSSRVPPHNLEAEESILGAMLLDTGAAKAGFAALEPGSFYSPKHQMVFEAMRRCRVDGIMLDAVSVSDELRRAGQLDEVGGTQHLLEMQNRTPAVSNAERYADIVASTAMSRALIALSSEIAEMAYGEIAPTEIIDKAKARLAESALRASQDSGLEDLTTFEQFVADQHARPVKYVIDRVLAAGERLMLIGVEGGAKSTIIRQIAIATAGGVHPFTQGPMEKRTTLYLELETPARATAHQANLALHGGRHVLTKPNDAWLLHRQGGMDLRSAKDQAEFERAVQFVRPELICVGPIYRAVRKKANESWEDALPELFDYFDDILVRYGCALVMEHHAPLGTGGVRELRAFGSSLWGRWPDMAWALQPEATDRQGRPTRIRLGTAGRGNRMDAEMPDFLVRGGSENLPWVGQNAPR